MALLQKIDLLLVVMLTGSFLGSLKSSLDVEKTLSKCTRVFNVALGMFCGMNVAHIFHKDLELGYIGLISLVGAMVGTNVLEVISELAPDMAKKYIKGKLK